MQRETKRSDQGYSVWIEAECWVAGTWSFEDTDTDVIVTWENGERWVATFVTYKHVLTLAERYKANGECLNGAYIWVSDMLLVDVATRPRIEEIIKNLLQSGDFQVIFTQLPPEEG